ncbi:Protein of unknown function [Leuconostoc citreum]|nr:Protein of unknown function [Leuconostoc citreum LBAE C10]CCF25692.1 Protein of unknown function [Leuconostoc citreum LBAE C11]CCF28014.1 Protein of unknown function [Leuconostoc citreum LBAE E16]CDX64609.1 Protein of unknown function [Leuconostoc citreum]CDX66309.1 Protein of unknown function [Leuconostoc citreum]
MNTSILKSNRYYYFWFM